MCSTFLGGLNIPDLSLYYDAAQLVNIMKILSVTNLTLNGWMDIESMCTPPSWL